MTDYLVTDTALTSIANAIRTKGGTSAQLEFPTEFVSAIGNIPTGGGSSVGIFSTYSYVDVQTTDATLLTAQHTIGSVPKLVTIEALSTPASGKIKHGLLTPFGGYCLDKDAASSSDYCMYPTESLTTSVRTFVMSSSELNVRRFSAAANWDTSITYRVGFYA